MGNLGENASKTLCRTEKCEMWNFIKSLTLVIILGSYSRIPYPRTKD